MGGRESAAHQTWLGALPGSGPGQAVAAVSQPLQPPPSPRTLLLLSVSLGLQTNFSPGPPTPSHLSHLTYVSSHLPLSQPRCRTQVSGLSGGGAIQELEGEWGFQAPETGDRGSARLGLE